MADGARPGTRWDATLYGRQDFVGWTGLGPIALLLEQVIGLEADAARDRLTWRIHRPDRHGVIGYRFGDQLIDMIVEDASESPRAIRVTTSDSFTLQVEYEGSPAVFEVARGEQRVLLD